MASYQERVAARIKAERKSRGLSREEAARQAGISFRQYQRWETGQSEPRDSNLRQLAEAWSVTVESLRPPDPEHEEQDVRDQLDRLEAKIDALLAHAGLDAAEVAAAAEPSLRVLEAAGGTPVGAESARPGRRLQGAAPSERPGDRAPRAAKRRAAGRSGRK